MREDLAHGGDSLARVGEHILGEHADHDQSLGLHEKVLPAVTAVARKVGEVMDPVDLDRDAVRAREDDARRRAVLDHLEATDLFEYRRLAHLRLTDEPAYLAEIAKKEHAHAR